MENITERFKPILSSQKGLTFGEALEALKKEKMACRKSWNDSNSMICIIEKDKYQIEKELGKPYQKSWIALKKSDNTIMPYTPSQDDLLSDDWYLC